jgi:hypothetical protein
VSLRKTLGKNATRPLYAIPTIVPYFFQYILYSRVDVEDKCNDFDFPTPLSTVLALDCNEFTFPMQISCSCTRLGFTKVFVTHERSVLLEQSREDAMRGAVCACESVCECVCVSVCVCVCVVCMSCWSRADKLRCEVLCSHYIHTHTYTHIHIRAHTRIRTARAEQRKCDVECCADTTYTHAHTRTQMNTHTHMHTHPHAHTHTQTHIHTHTHTCWSRAEKMRCGVLC